MILDDIPKMEELNKAMQLIGTGISIDGIPPNVAKILPHSMKEVILDLVKKVFFHEYPDEWTKQILHSIKKDGHAANDPTLRGIAIAPFLCRLYDIIIDMRFCAWYISIYEQSGFRPGLG